MKNISKLAAEIKKRDNPSEIKPCLAKIVSLSPLTVKIGELGIQAVIGKNLVLTNTVQSIAETLSNGDELLIIPSTKFYAIDKVG